MKRLLASVLCLVMLMGMMTFPAHAAQTYEIKDTYYPAWGRKPLEKFVSITADSVKKGGQTAVGDFMTYHTYNNREVDTYLVEGAAKMSVGTPMALDIIVCHGSSWDEVRANKTSYVEPESLDQFSEAAYALDKPGVYMVELGFYDIPVKVSFAVEVSASGSAQTPVAPAPVRRTFSDVPESYWGYTAIMICADKGVIGGMTEADENGVGTYEPEGEVTLGQFLAVLTRLVCPEKIGSADGHWAMKYYLAAVESGVIGSGDFAATGEALDTALSREEMAAILVGAAEANEETLGVLDGIESTIRDYETVSVDKRAAVLACYSNGLITGIGNDHFGPQGTMNRAQMATVVCRLMNYIPRASV